MDRLVEEYIETNPVFMLANVDENGFPRVRPMICIGIRNDKLYFATTIYKRVYNELLNDNRVEIANSIMSRWLRITGTVSFEETQNIVDDIIKKSDIVETFYKNNSVSDECVRVFYLNISSGILSDLSRNIHIEF